MLRLTPLALVLSLFIPSATLFAQDCFPTFITLDSEMTDGGPSWVEWGLSDDQGNLLQDGIAQYTPDDPFYEEALCLGAGCYSLTVAAQEPIDPLAVFFWINVEEGFINEFENGFDGTQAFIDFCIAAPQPCELEVVADPLDCSSWVFNVTEINPNATSVQWFVNDEFTNQGEAFTFVAESAGSYQICAGYETPDCPDGVFWCETFTVSEDCFGQECPDEIIAENPVENCFNYIFEIPGIPNEYIVTWTIGNNESYTDGTFTDHIFEENGVYEICAFIETPDCPNGVEICTELVVNCSDDCELDVSVTQLDCSPVILDASNYPDGAIIEWFVDGAFFSTGDLFTFEPNEAGSYQICAGYETPDCPDGVFWCETFTVSEDCFGQECPDEIIAENPVENCFNYIFEIPGIPNEYIVTWTIGNNESYTDGTFTDHIFEENGVYEICAFIETPDCPNGVEICTELVVNCSDDCELDVSVTQLDCSPVILDASNYPDGAIIEWFVDGAFFSTGDLFTFEANEAGSYQICAQYNLPDCGGEVDWCETFTVSEDCFGQECPDDIVAENPTENCYNYIFEIPGIPNEYIVTWTIGNNESYTDGTFTDHIFEENGVYEICAFIETPDCPNGVEICTELVVNCSDDQECFLEADAEMMFSNIYVFGAEAPDDATVFWAVNGEPAGQGYVLTYEFEDAGTYEVCASYETPDCPLGAIDCFNIFVLDADFEDCTNVELIIESNDDLMSNLDIDYFLEGLELFFGGEFTYYSDDESTSLEACIPDGCWSITMNMDEFESAALYLALIIDGGLAVNYEVNPDESEVYVEFGVNADCSKGVSESASAVSIFPNPASDYLVISANIAAGTPYQLTDMAGRAVLSGNTQGTVTTLDIAALPAGMYLLRWPHNDQLTVQKLQVNR